MATDKKSVVATSVKVGDDFQDIQNEQSFCNGKAVMREAIIKMLNQEKECVSGATRSQIVYLIWKIENLEA